MMVWDKLLSANRSVDDYKSETKETRSQFERDYDRIIFSHPFRMLQDKTQVFPMPEDDFVHSRLTHSLEVSVAGRSLGKEVGKRLMEKYPDVAQAGVGFQEIGAITAAASLAHDIGNPPFGHSGEACISSFFADTVSGQRFKKSVSTAEWADLVSFEGNAQGFRILNSPMYGGLKLTFATMAAFMKYPRSSSAPRVKDRKSQKKYGFYQSNSDAFGIMAENLGLLKLGHQSWTRHPLAFLVEAADDICYTIIDLEDATRLGLVSHEETTSRLGAVLKNKFQPEKLEKINDKNEQISVLRAVAINELIHQCADIFMTHEEAIRRGEFDQALTDLIPSSEALTTIVKLSIEKIYRSQQVIEREAAGYAIIDYLMESFCIAAYYKHFEPEKFTKKHMAAFALLPAGFKHLLDNQSNTVYETLQIILDFISGLTDTSAFKYKRILSGQGFS